MTLYEKQKKKGFTATTIFILIACVCVIVQMYTLPNKRLFWMSLSNRTMLIMWFGIMLYTLAVHGTKEMMGEIALFTFVLIAFMLSVSENIRRLSTSFSVLLNFVAMPMMMIYLAFHEVDDTAKKVLLITNLVLSLIFIYLSESKLAYRFDGDYYITYITELTLGYANPNQTAIYLFICALNLMVGVFYFRNILVKALYGLDFVYMLVLIEKTKCRTSLLLIGVFLILVVIHKVSKLMVDVAIWVPIIYALIAQFMFSYFKDLTFMGESLFNGRENVFARYFDNLNFPRFLFGNFVVFDFDNMHNAYVSIAATGGILLLITFIRMLKRHLLRNLELGINKGYERVAFIGFVCVILYGSTEAAGFVGGTNYAFLNVSLLAYFSKGFARERAPEISALDNSGPEGT